MTRLAESLGGGYGGSSAATARASEPAPSRAPEPVYVAPAPEPVYVAPAPEPVYVAPAPEPVLVAPAPELALVAPAPVQAAPVGKPVSGTKEHYERVVTDCLNLTGARGAAVFDVATGQLLAGASNDASLDLAVAANVSAELVRAKLTTMKSLGLHESMEDIVATFTDSFHILGSMSADNSVFAFLAVNNKSQLSLIRLRFTKLRDNTA